MRNINLKYFLGHRMYLYILLSNTLMLLFDSMMWSLSEKQGLVFYGLNVLFTTLYYIACPLTCMFWSLFVDYQINRNFTRIKRLLVPFLSLIIFNAVLSVLSIGNNVLFYIDSNNHYTRGIFFNLMVAISYFFLIYSAIYVLVKRKQIPKTILMPLILFPIIPTIGGIIQVLFFGVSLIWISMTLSLLIIYINTQNEQIYTDFLTGLYNRRQFDIFIEDKFKNNNGDKTLAGIMIDINHFKSINDNFGHLTGDKALEETAGILKRSVRKDDFVARFGGDEFIIILEDVDSNTLHSVIDRINENTRTFNHDSANPYEISFSIGYDFTNETDMGKARDFIHHIDDLMYQSKPDHKQKV